MWDEILVNYTLRVVLLGTALLGATAGAVGVFLTLKKQALVGDALSHAALPGIILAYILTSQSALYISIIGAIVASILSIFLIETIKRFSVIKNDAALAIILSSMFGFGQVLLSIIRDTAGQDQARLKTFIFGQAATMSASDITFLMVILALVFIAIVIFWRHIKLVLFNRDFYQSLGFSSRLIDIVLNALTILVVVAGIQSVGVILMSALLIAPSVAARLWSNRLSINVLIAAFIGSLSGILGTLFGMSMATGPVIVIFVTSFVILSLLIAPKKGIIWVKVSEAIHKKQIKKYHALIHIFETNHAQGIKQDELHFFSEMGYLSSSQEGYQLTQKGMDKVAGIMVGNLK